MCIRDRCDVELGDRHLCPACLESGKGTGKITGLQTDRTLYDNIALALAVYPLLIFWLTFVTAPVALYMALRYWNAPSSLVPRTKLRLVLALGLAGLQIAGWLLLIIFLVTR